MLFLYSSSVKKYNVKLKLEGKKENWLYVNTLLFFIIYFCIISDECLLFETSKYQVT